MDQNWAPILDQVYMLITTYCLGEPQPREVLIDMLWPDAAAKAGRHRLSVTLSSLRKQLEPTGIERGAVLEADRSAICLRADAADTDVASARELLAAELGREAVGLVAALADRDPGAALLAARQAVALDPLSEEARQWLIRLALAAGDRALAERTYQEFEQRLADELDAEPLAAPKRELKLGTITAVALRCHARHNGGRGLDRERVAELAAEPGGRVVEAATQQCLAEFGGMVAALEFLESVRRHAADGAPAAVLHAGEGHGEGRALQVREVCRTLLGSALPNQVLCTASAAELIQQAGEDGCDTVDLGPWELHHGAGAVALAALHHPEWPARREPPRGLRRPRPVGLPVYAGALFNQEAELASLETTLREGEHRLLTLVGEGGIGKTRVASAVAEAASQTLLEPAVWVDLARVRSAPEVAPAIALAATGRVPGSPGIEPLAEALGERSRLLVLDNFEHVLEAAAVCGALVARLPNLRVLTTSRAPLAAAWVWSFGPAQILEQLRASRQMLRDRRPGRVDRHRSVRACIAWSYGLLAEHEAAAFRRLAVASGSVDREAAQALAGTGNAAVLRTLIQHSLLRTESVDGRVRYTMPELIREFATETLQRSGEAPAALAALGRVFCERGMQIACRSGQADWTELAPPWQDADHYARALQGALSEGADDEIHGTLTAHRYIMARHRLVTDAARSALAAAWEQARSRPDLRWAPEAVVNHLSSLATSDDQRRAMPWVEEALALCDRHPTHRAGLEVAELAYRICVGNGGHRDMNRYAAEVEKRMGTPEDAPEAALAMAGRHRACGRHEQAMRLARRLRDTLLEREGGRWTPTALRAQAGLLDALIALTRFEESLLLADDASRPPA